MPSAEAEESVMARYIGPVCRLCRREAMKLFLKGDIPSYSVKAGDVIGVISRTQKNVTIEHAMEEVKGRGIPEWLSFDAAAISGRIVSMPTREQINLPVQEQLIVELYSK